MKMTKQLITIGKQKKDEDGKPMKEKKKYTCKWCNNSFMAFVRRIQHGSNQVQCPYCKNFLKTWD